MNAPKHFKGRLYVTERRAVVPFCLVSTEGPVAKAVWGVARPADEEVIEANARRLAACWNYCLDMSNEELMFTPRGKQDELF